MRRKLKCECFTPNGRYKDKNGELDETEGEGRNWLFSRCPSFDSEEILFYLVFFQVQHRVEMWLACRLDRANWLC